MATDFPHTDSESMIIQRVKEELIKRGFGPKDVEITFPVQLGRDVDLFENFRLQDPFGLSVTGEGEEARYFYIQNIRYNPMANTMDVTAVDLQYLLRQYFIFGDRAVLPTLWTNANEDQKMYGYFCDRVTSKFSDGDYGKYWANRNLLGGGV